MPEVKLIIPRQPYGNLQRPGAGRVNTELSPEGMAALERLTTCSRGAVLDLAVQVLDVAIHGNLWQLEAVADKLLELTENDTQLIWLADGLKNVSYALFDRVEEV